ncbi:hypothetical protein V5O48_013204 [Marasmius crinis-equi]|uniref:Uncharacterized protein n=1 Tax=Marasmius crinis-equi TaxID=585013 RepID=A0ABR3F0Q5_9AGAR
MSDTELPNELQMEAFAYGENGKRIEIKLHPRVPDDRLGKPRQIDEWGVDFAKKLLHDVKHAEKWKCEFCGGHAVLPKVQAAFWTHLSPPRLVLYIHETCNSSACKFRFELMLMELDVMPGTLNNIQFENDNDTPPVSGCCIKCGREKGDNTTAQLSRCATCRLTRWARLPWRQFAAGC